MRERPIIFTPQEAKGKGSAGADGTKTPAAAATIHALTFDAFRSANKARCLKWHPGGIEAWSPSDWLTAVTGELGELASLLKMRNRERDGLPGNKFSPTQKQIADELADVFTYLDLLACALGVDLGRAAAVKFNEVSERVGFPDRIKTTAAPQGGRLGQSPSAQSGGDDSGSDRNLGGPAAAATTCVYEARKKWGPGDSALDEPWCKEHGFDCPNLKA